MHEIPNFMHVPGCVLRFAMPTLSRGRSMPPAPEHALGISSELGCYLVLHCACDVFSRTLRRAARRRIVLSGAPEDGCVSFSRALVATRPCRTQARVAHEVRRVDAGRMLSAMWVCGEAHIIAMNASSERRSLRDRRASEDKTRHSCRDSSMAHPGRACPVHLHGPTVAHV